MPSPLARRAFLHASGALLALVLAAAPLPGAAELPKPDRAGHVDVPGGKVYYVLYGAKHLLANGKAALVALHGGPGGSHEDLLALAELADERPVVLYDQLDSGASDKPGDPANWTVRRFVAELAVVRAGLGLDRVVVLGQSWGGAVAAEYATTRPPGLLGVVLSSPLISTPRAMADMEAYRKALPEDVYATLRRHEAAGTIHEHEYEQAKEQFENRHFFRGDTITEEQSATKFNNIIYNYMWGPAEFRATGTLKDYDIQSQLYIINVPTLFICGQHDEVTPAACLDFGRAVNDWDGWQDPEVAIIPGGSHGAHHERRGLYLRIVREFLAPLG